MVFTFRWLYALEVIGGYWQRAGLETFYWYCLILTSVLLSLSNVLTWRISVLP